MAANLLVLHDPGRRKENSTPQKPPGCVHGDSVGVHASDAANAWRNIARVSDQRNKIASLIVGRLPHGGTKRPDRQGWVSVQPFIIDEIKSKDGGTLLLGQAEGSGSAGKDQARASCDRAALWRFETSCTSGF